MHGNSLQDRLEMYLEALNPHLLPELAADLVATLAHLDVDDLPGHGAALLAA